MGIPQEPAADNTPKYPHKCCPHSHAHICFHKGRHWSRQGGVQVEASKAVERKDQHSRSDKTHPYLDKAEVSGKATAGHANSAADQHRDGNQQDKDDGYAEIIAQTNRNGDPIDRGYRIGEKGQAGHAGFGTNQGTGESQDDFARDPGANPREEEKSHQVQDTTAQQEQRPSLVRFSLLEPENHQNYGDSDDTDDKDRSHRIFTSSFLSC